MIQDAMQYMRKHRRECVIVVVLFVFALALRIVYLNNTEVIDPIRGDATKYFSTAFNIRYFGTYSSDIPQDYFTPPANRTALSPGYPLFLTLFLREDDTNTTFLARVFTVQAVLGALTAVFTFLLARLALTMPWALVAGILAAINPHLIAMDGFLLTESLFTFSLMLGTLLLATAWKSGRSLATLTAGIILTFSAYVRQVNTLFLLFLAPVFFLPRNRGETARPPVARQLALLFAGFAVVTGAYYGFVAVTAPPDTGIVEDKPNPIMVQIRQFLPPPAFYVNNESHIALYHENLDYRSATDHAFSDDPLPYVTWHLWGKYYYFWHWDNVYNGDVSIYPVSRGGFQENPFLAGIHTGMHILHWPLYLLSLSCVAASAIRWRRRTLTDRGRALLFPLLGFVYFHAFHSLFFWLPRYSIPVRPFASILAAATLSWLFFWFSNRNTGISPGKPPDKPHLSKKRRSWR